MPISLEDFSNDERRLDALLASDDDLAYELTRLAMSFVAELVTRIEQAEERGMPGPPTMIPLGKVQAQLVEREELVFSVRSKEFIDTSLRNAVEVGCNPRAYDEATAYGALNNLGYWLFFFPVLARDPLMMSETSATRTEHNEKFVERYRILLNAVEARIDELPTIRWMLKPFPAITRSRAGAPSTR